MVKSRIHTEGLLDTLKLRLPEMPVDDNGALHVYDYEDTTVIVPACQEQPLRTDHMRELVYCVNLALGYEIDDTDGHVTATSTDTPHIERVGNITVTTHDPDMARQAIEQYPTRHGRLACVLGRTGVLLHHTSRSGYEALQREFASAENAHLLTNGQFEHNHSQTNRHF